MTEQGSVTFWIGQLKAGERAAVQQLWQVYFRQLVALARGRLPASSRQVADEEDVALHAFDSFCRAAEAGRFPRLEDRDDLWQILVLLTGRKAVDLLREQHRQKRGGGDLLQSLAVPAGDGDSAVFIEVIGREPDPAMALQVAEQCQRLLALLPDDQLRQVALWKLEGYTNAEIAGKLGRSEVAVERKLRAIRGHWRETGPDQPADSPE